jgi:hypothetical protein
MITNLVVKEIFKGILDQEEEEKQPGKCRKEKHPTK